MTPASIDLQVVHTLDNIDLRQPIIPAYGAGVDSTAMIIGPCGGLIRRNSCFPNSDYPTEAIHKILSPDVDPHYPPSIFHRESARGDDRRHTC